jgi:hypothetical protein
MYYRYLATDRYGSYSLLSPQPLFAPEGVELRLLEATDDYSAVSRRHVALADRLSRDVGRRRTPETPRGPAA